MNCSDTIEEKEKALEKILPYQQKELHEALEGDSVIVRYLDSTLHEFVQTEEADIEKLTKAQGKSVDRMKEIIST